MVHTDHVNDMIPGCLVITVRSLYGGLTKRLFAHGTSVPVNTICIMLQIATTSAFYPQCTQLSTFTHKLTAIIMSPDGKLHAIVFIPGHIDHYMAIIA